MEPTTTSPDQAGQGNSEHTPSGTVTQSTTTTTRGNLFLSTLKYIGTMLSERAVFYIFPLFLLFLEWALKTAGQLETFSLIGTTMASIGVGFIMPLTAIKKRDLTKFIDNEADRKKFEEYIRKGAVEPVGRDEKNFAYFCWLLTFVCTALWVISLLTLLNEPDKMIWQRIPAHYVPGLINYFLGVILCEVKERMSAKTNEAK